MVRPCMGQCRSDSGVIAEIIKTMTVSAVWATEPPLVSLGRQGGGGGWAGGGGLLEERLSGKM